MAGSRRTVFSSGSVIQIDSYAHPRENGQGFERAVHASFLPEPRGPRGDQNVSPTHSHLDILHLFAEGRTNLLLDTPLQRGAGVGGTFSPWSLAGRLPGVRWQSCRRPEHRR